MKLIQHRTLKWYGALAALLICSAKAFAAAPLQYIVEPHRYNNVIYLPYVLEADAITKIEPKSSARNGQFQLRLDPKFFPIAAPGCNGDLILRMPSIIPYPPRPSDQASLEKKWALLERIKALKAGNAAPIPLKITLTPYVEVKQQRPLVLELKYCNIFFEEDWQAPVVRYAQPSSK